MRVLNQGKLMRATRTELSILLAGSRANLPEGSTAARAGHTNLQNIRRAFARPDVWPG